MQEQNYIQYNRSNLDRARYNRKNPTLAEQKIWKEILCNYQTGYKFSRQKMIDSFIVDFYCSKLLVAIEIDGEIHNNQEVYDSQRTDKINNQGIMVIRYTNKEVLEHIQDLKQDLLERLEQRKMHIEKYHKF